MAWVRVNDVAKYGIVQDIPSKELPPGAWADGRNVRFRPGHVEPIRNAANVAGAALHEVLIGTQFRTPTGVTYTLYAGKTNVSYIDDAQIHIPALDATIPPFVTQPGRWTVMKLGAVPILNSRDLPSPLWWNDSTNKLIQLPNWPAGLRCYSLRAFKNHLIALRCIESGNEYPHMIRWSHPADPGLPPPSWDYTNPTIDAGRVELGELDTPIVDGLPLGPAFFIYREGSVHRMDYIGPPLVFAFQTVFDNFGTLAANCVKAWRGAHVVMTADNIVLHDGQHVKALLTNRIRNYYIETLAAAADKSQSFLAINPATDEAWAFLANSSSIAPPAVAIVVNLRTGAATIVEEQAWSCWLGLPIGTPDSWGSGDPAAWDTGLDIPWNTATGAGSTLSVYLGRDTDIATLEGGDTKSGYLERLAAPVGDHNQRVLLKRLRFIADDFSGLTVKTAASSNVPTGAAFPASGSPIAPSGDVLTIKNGIWHSIRLEWAQGAAWRGFSGYAAEFERSGEF